MIGTMKSTIDSAGRLVIPKAIRSEAGLKPGMSLEVCWRGGKIEIEPVSVPVRLVRKGGLLVAIPQKDVTSLTADAVERTRQSIRRDQSRHK